MPCATRWSTATCSPYRPTASFARPMTDSVAAEIRLTTIERSTCVRRGWLWICHEADEGDGLTRKSDRSNVAATSGSGYTVLVVPETTTLPTNSPGPSTSRSTASAIDP